VGLVCSSSDTVYGARVGCGDLPSDWLISIKRLAFLAAAAAGCK